MIKSKLLTSILFLLGIIVIGSSVRSQETEYKDYQMTSLKQEYFKITLQRGYVKVSIPEADGYKTVRHKANDIKQKGDIVYGGDLFLFNSEGLVVDNVLYPYDRIYDTRLNERNDQIILTFFTKNNMPTRLSRTRRGNIISFTDKIIIEEDEFIRGIIFSVKGDIDVYGEVNKDVISLFGNVYIGDGAVVRGDVATLTGRANADRDASIYGEIFTGKGRRIVHRRRFYHREEEFSFTPAFRYNRVDGAAIYSTFKYEDLDSLLPSVWFTGGYAFASERWRYEAGLEQVLWRNRPLSVGGAFYRKLASQDDWFISDRENLFFTLLVTEDFKDYYEAEGGRLYTRFKPLENLSFEGGYQYEETKWLRSNRNLWSLFGGDKVFARNFGSVAEPYRQVGIGEIDSTVNAGLYAQLEFDTRDTDEPFERSAWAATGMVEWSHPDFESDFDYRRYTVNLRRYQKVNRHSILLFRGMYGGSDGYLPMYKRFFIGGPGTLDGYKHKEFMGSRFWMINLEYRITFPSSDISYSLLYDVGQTANSTSFESGDEIRHSIGMALYIENDLRLSISKRFDSADDKDPKIYARLTHQF